MELRRGLRRTLLWWNLVVVLGFELCEALSCVMRFVGWMGRFSRTALTSVGALAPGCLADAT